MSVAQDEPRVAPSRPPSMAVTRVLLVLLPLLVWLAATAVFWLGYVGSDDLFYSRYAALLHRPPMNWWEFRMPAVLSIRASFLTLGMSELAAALPSLLASLLILASVACFVGWPRNRSWPAQAAVLMAATMPLDVAMRSVPGASLLAAGLLTFGTVCLVRGRGRVPFVGAAILALAFSTHEISFFYVAILCCVALVHDPRRFRLPVLVCVLIAGLLVILEAGIYWTLLGEPLARFRVSAGTTSDLPTGFDPDTGIGGARFYLWPIQLAFGQPFGASLGLLLVCGSLAWRRLAQDQRILLLTTFLVWGYLGYGSQVPWDYKPLYRQYHYYPALSLGICALLPVALASALRRPRWAAPAVASGAIGLHLAVCALAGPWGQEVNVSRELLGHARAHSERTYLTDVKTLNHMYALNGFRLPENVVCLNGPIVEQHFLANKEPFGVPRFEFPELPFDGFLLNLDQRDLETFSPDFAHFVSQHEPDGSRARIAPVRYRMLLAPWVPLLGERDFMIRSRGGAVVELERRVQP